METPLILPDNFMTIGVAAAMTSIFCMVLSLGHVFFYHEHGQAQRDHNMQSLACRMKVLFLVMSFNYGVAIISGVGMIVNYTMHTWYIICAVNVLVNFSYVGAALWLKIFYGNMSNPK